MLPPLVTHGDALHNLLMERLGHGDATLRRLLYNDACCLFVVLAPLVAHGDALHSLLMELLSHEAILKIIFDCGNPTDWTKNLLTEIFFFDTLKNRRLADCELRNS